MQIKRRRFFHYIKAYRFRSVFFRNLLSIIILVSLPIVLLILLYSAHLHQRSENDLKAAHIETLSRTASVIDNVFYELESYTYMLSIDHNVKMFVFLEAEQLEKSPYIEDIIQSVAVFTGTFNYVESVYFYSEDNQLMIYENGLLPFSSMPDVSWLPAYQEMTDATFRIDARLKNDYYPYYLTLTYPIKNSHKREGAVIVNINIEKLAHFADSSGDTELYLIDPDGHMLYASDVRRLTTSGLTL